MANKIQIKRGAQASIPTLSDGEIGWCTDTFRAYVGQGGTNRLIGEADFMKLSGGTFTGAVTLSGAPSSDLHAATKAYVDSVAQGLKAKTSVRAASTGNLTLSGTQTIDGVSCVADDRVLVKDQTTASGNGIYIVSASSWSRAGDANTWDELVSAFTFVEEGTTNADTGWTCTVDSGGTLETTSVAFTQFSGAGSITAGDGLTKSGNTLNVGAGNGIAVNADDVTIDIDGSTLSLSSSGIKVADAGITATQLASSVAGDGLTGGAGTALAVNVGTGLEISGDAVRISTAAAGTGLSGGGGSALSVSYGTSAGTAAQGNDSRLHTQNTDTGTTSITFFIGTGGPRLKQSGSGTVEIRNSGDTAYGSLVCGGANGLQIANNTGPAFCAIAYAGSNNRSYSLPDNNGTYILNDASTIDGGTF